MSVTINFYTNLSDKDYTRKNLTNEISKTCELKGDVSVTDPVLIVTGDASTFSLVNYMYIPDFHRYYFCTCTALPGGLIEVRGTRDVLSSAWAYISNHKAVIERQENRFNLYLNDGTFASYCNDQVITKNFSGGFTTPSYVLVVAG